MKELIQIKNLSKKFGKVNVRGILKRTCNYP